MCFWQLLSLIIGSGTYANLIVSPLYGTLKRLLVAIQAFIAASTQRCLVKRGSQSSVWLMRASLADRGSPATRRGAMLLSLRHMLTHGFV